MPCIDAIIENSVMFSPATTVEKAMAMLKQARMDFGVVLDDDNKPVGVFSVRVLLQDVMPVAVPGMGGVVIDAAPGIAKRLNKVKNRQVREVMDNNMLTLKMNTRIAEGIKTVTEYKTPVLILDEEGGFEGVISEQSLLNYLEKQSYSSE